MKVLISGSTGLVGGALSTALAGWGYTVHRLQRDPGMVGPETLYWNPAQGEIKPLELEGYDAVIHLAGENVGSGRWTKAKKQRIRDSRIEGTRLLSQALAGLEKPPKTFLVASAIGYYGNRGDEQLTEIAGPGKGFLSGVVRDWEQETQVAREAGIRTVNMRIGVVLSPNGGALKKMLLPFKLGLGGVMGDGQQYMSWIVLDDLCRAMHHLLTHGDIDGPVNLVAPNAVTNYEFTKTLGKVLGRPTIFPMPAFAAKLAFGQMADELLLSSTRVLPQRLQQSGFEFQCPELKQALEHVL